MPEHPIQGLMQTAMKSIKDMVDVNTIVGDAVQAPDGTVIIPISTVSFGFAAGGGEYGLPESSNKKHDENSADGKYPFAGGSGAGVNITPVAFMVVGQNQIKLMPVNMNSAVNKILDLVPDIIDKANDTIKKKFSIKKDLSSSNLTPKYIRVDDE